MGRGFTTVGRRGVGGTQVQVVGDGTTRAQNGLTWPDEDAKQARRDLIMVLVTALAAAVLCIVLYRCLTP